MSAILEVAHVSKRFAMGGILSRRHVEAVTDASFSIEEGQPEVFTIVGESGSGKTTLARMMLGLEAPTEGEIRLSGRSMAERRGRAARIEFMRHAQPVFQNPFEAFNPLKRVDRYLDASARVLLGARGPEAVDAAMDEALHKVGLSLAEVRGRYAHELSGGQLQRVAIASRLTGGRPSSRTVSQWFPAPASPAFRYSTKPTSKLPTTKSTKPSRS